MSLPGAKLLAKALEVGSGLAEPLVKSLAGKASSLRDRFVHDVLDPYVLPRLPGSWVCKHCSKEPKAPASDQVKAKTKKSVNSSSRSGAAK